MNKLYSTDIYYLVTDCIIEMNCRANSYKEASDLFMTYLKNQNDECIYELNRIGEIYEYKCHKLNTIHFIFNKHYIDVLRRHK